jgi:WD40 repeat protein
MFVVVRCTHCRQQLRLAAAYVGQAVRCSLCQGVFTAQADPAPPPPQEPSVSEQASVPPAPSREAAVSAKETATPRPSSAAEPPPAARTERRSSPPPGSPPPEAAPKQAAQVETSPALAAVTDTSPNTAAPAADKPSQTPAKKSAGAPAAAPPKPAKAVAKKPPAVPTPAPTPRAKTPPPAQQPAEPPPRSAKLSRPRESGPWSNLGLSARRYEKPKVYPRAPYLFLLALLPVGIPVLAAGSAVLGGVELGWLGAGLFTALGLSLLVPGFMVAAAKSWPVAARTGALLALSGLGYGLLIGFLGMGGMTTLRGGIPAAAWDEFAPPEGRFRVMMPGTPTRRDLVPTDTPGLTLFGVDWDRGNVAFLAGYGDLSEGELRETPWEQRLAGERDGVLKNQRNGKLVEDKVIELGGHPGREFVVGVAGKGVLATRVYGVGHRLYLLMAGGLGVAADDRDVQMFFNSFALLDSPGETAPPSPDPRREKAPAAPGQPSPTIWDRDGTDPQPAGSLDEAPPDDPGQPAQGPEPASLAGHTGPVQALAFSAHGRTLVSAGEDQTLRFWDLAARKERRAVRTEAAAVRAVAMHPRTGQVAAAVGAKVQLWNREGTAVAATYDAGEGGDIAGLAFDPRTQTLLAAAASRVVKVWNVNTGKVQVTLEDFKLPIKSLAFFPDGKALALGGDDTTVQIWDLSPPKERAVLHGHNGWVWSVAVAPDGKHLATAGEDKTIRLWDAATGKDLRTLTGHEGPVFAVAYTPDGKTLISAGDDGFVKLWDVATGRERLTLQAHPRRLPVRALAVAPDGKTLAAGTDDAIKLWDLP